MSVLLARERSILTCQEGSCAFVWPFIIFNLFDNKEIINGLGGCACFKANIEMETFREAQTHREASFHIFGRSIIFR